VWLAKWTIMVIIGWVGLWDGDGGTRLRHPHPDGLLVLQVVYIELTTIFFIFSSIMVIPMRKESRGKVLD
jgi:hypothetical protein